MTNEFSFVLRASTHGIGVFATHDIPEGSFLRLFGDQGSPKIVSVSIDSHDIPSPFEMYCIYREEGLIRPVDFGCMEVGWYLNHSDQPNAFHKSYDFFALREIKSGEEILIDYHSLEEPEEFKEPFFKRSFEV